MSFRSALLFAALSLVVGFFAIESIGCARPAEGPSLPAERALARAAVLTTAAAVRTADEACAAVGEARGDVELLDACVDAYEIASEALFSTAHALDAWGDGSLSSVSCAVHHAFAAAQGLADAIRARGAAVPDVLEDARVLVIALPRCADGR